MNTYNNNFKKYEEITKKDYESLLEIVEIIDKVKEPTIENPKSNAIIILGFSGNGKTTYINNFIKQNKDYQIASMDELGKKLIIKYNKIPGREIVEEFGKVIEKLTNEGKNIIIDGFFLNLFTRMALIDTLHEKGYNVTVVDLTKSINKTLEYRIIDETARLLNIKPSQNNLFQIIFSKEYKKVRESVLSYYEDEKKRSFIDLQNELNLLEYGADKYLTKEATNEELISIKREQK